MVEVYRLINTNNKVVELPLLYLNKFEQFHDDFYLKVSLLYTLISLYSFK